MTDQVVPVNVQFQRMAEGHAFKLFMAAVKKKVDREKDKFWDMEDDVKSSIQRLKARHFDELFNYMENLIINTSQEKKR